MTFVIETQYQFSISLYWPRPCYLWFLALVWKFRVCICKFLTIRCFRCRFPTACTMGRGGAFQTARQHERQNHFLIEQVSASLLREWSYPNWLLQYVHLSFQVAIITVHVGNIHVASRRQPPAPHIYILHHFDMCPYLILTSTCIVHMYIYIYIQYVDS